MPKRESTQAPDPAPERRGMSGPTGSAVEAGRSRLGRAWPYAAIVLLSILAYANTLGHGFVYDDSHIARSPLLHEPWNLRAVWNGDFYGPRKPQLTLYRPLADWGFLLNYRLNELLFGDGPSSIGFHSVDILLHAAVGCLMFAWLRRLELALPVCLIAALLFSVHPLHTETVANTANRSDAQAAVFGLAFLLLHARRVPVLPAVLYMCAMWSKESAVAFFPLAVAMDALLPGTYAPDSALGTGGGMVAKKRWPLLDYAVLGATLALWFWLRARALGGLPMNFTFVENPLQVASLTDRILTAGAIQLRYLGLLCLPIGLSSDYSYDEIPTVHSFIDPGALGFFGVLIAAIALGWRLRFSMPAVTLAILGYAVLFSTTSNFLLPIGTMMAERLAYTPSILFCALVAIGVWELRTRVGVCAIAVAVGVTCSVFLVLSLERNKTWKDNPTFSREQVRTAPRSAKAHISMGLSLVESGDERGAIQEYERSLEILPFYPRTHYLLGNALHRLKEDPERVIRSYQQVIVLDPTHIDARVNLALTLIELGRLDEARLVVDEIRALDPKHEWLPELAKRLSGQAGRSGTPPK